MSNLAVSLRNGKYQPSVRYKPKESFLQNETNWRMGIDKPTFSTTYQSASRETASVPAEVHMMRQPRVDKNASDKDAIQGEQIGPYSQPHLVFQTTNKTQFHPSYTALSSQYERVGPAYDRISSCKTNYSLGEYKGGKAVSAAHTHHQHPSNHGPTQQANIGGWHGPEGTYRTDIENRDCIKRGGGGGEGSLGLRFNIVTGEKNDALRNHVKMRTGPRVTMNRKDAWRQGSDHFGDYSEPVSIITGKGKAPPVAPPRQHPDALMRPNQPVLNTQPW